MMTASLMSRLVKSAIERRVPLIVGVYLGVSWALVEFVAFNVESPKSHSQLVVRPSVVSSKKIISLRPACRPDREMIDATDQRTDDPGQFDSRNPWRLNRRACSTA